MQSKFNTIHAAVRSIVQRGFGSLKGKFRHLKGTDATNLRYALNMIEAAFVLHNFILFNEQKCDDEDEQGHALAIMYITVKYNCFIGNSSVGLCDIVVHRF